MPSVISIHVPKSAGTSLLKLFQVAFGSENVLADYEDRPGNPISQMYLDPVRWEKSRPKSLPAGVSVVHGHFHPCKYDHISDAFRMTFLRHPVCNLISTYLYWKAIPPQPNPLHRYFLDNNLGVFELAQIPLLRYLLSKTYFGGWDMAKLDFIGRHETRKDDLKCLEPLLGCPCCCCCRWKAPV